MLQKVLLGSKIRLTVAVYHFIVKVPIWEFLSLLLYHANNRTELMLLIMLPFLLYLPPCKFSSTSFTVQNLNDI
jgi:hypothetical protein